MVHACAARITTMQPTANAFRTITPLRSARFSWEPGPWAWGGARGAAVGGNRHSSRPSSHNYSFSGLPGADTQQGPAQPALRAAGGGKVKTGRGLGAHRTSYPRKTKRSFVCGERRAGQPAPASCMRWLGTGSARWVWGDPYSGQMIWKRSSGIVSGLLAFLAASAHALGAPGNSFGFWPQRLISSANAIGPRLTATAGTSPSFRSNWASVATGIAPSTGSHQTRAFLPGFTPTATRTPLASGRGAFS